RAASLRSPTRRSSDLTTAIYKSWYGLFNRNAAAQLASLLLVFVLLVLALERFGRGRARFEQQGARQVHRVRPRGIMPWLLTLFAGTVFFLAFALPVGRLVYWVADSAWRDLDARYVGLIWRTLVLGLGAASVTVSLALLLGYVRRTRQHRLLRVAVRSATIGYALPGSVLAVGIVMSFAAIDRLLSHTFGTGQVLMGGLLALQMAYVVRFLAVAFGPVETAFERVRPRLIDAARTL